MLALVVAGLAGATLGYLASANEDLLSRIWKTCAFGGIAALAVWQGFLRPVRTDPDDPASEVLAWRARSIAAKAATRATIMPPSPAPTPRSLR